MTGRAGIFYKSAGSAALAKKAKKPKKEKDPRFEFSGAPGPMVPLVNGYGQQVRCTVWPGSLLDMYRVGALRGEAHEYAARLAEKSLTYDVCEVSDPEGDNGLCRGQDSTERTVPLVQGVRSSDAA